MKNSFLILVFLAGGISLAHSQEFSLGPTVGVNSSWIDDVPGDNEAMIGFNAGLTMVYSTEEHWGVGVDLKYSTEGGDTKLRGLNGKSDLNYVRVPLKVIYFFNNFGNDLRPKIYLGPSFGFLVGGKTDRFLESSTVEVDSKDIYEDFDAGIVFGTGINYRVSPGAWLNLDLAYGHGITNIAKIGKGYNRNISLNLGIAWGI